MIFVCKQFCIVNCFHSCHTDRNEPSPTLYTANNDSFIILQFTFKSDNTYRRFKVTINELQKKESPKKSRSNHKKVHYLRFINKQRETQNHNL